jgi:hypothetical protein
MPFRANGLNRDSCAFGAKKQCLFSDMVIFLFDINHADAIGCGIDKVKAA